MFVDVRAIKGLTARFPGCAGSKELTDANGRKRRFLSAWREAYPKRSHRVRPGGTLGKIIELLAPEIKLPTSLQVSKQTKENDRSPHK